MASSSGKDDICMSDEAWNGFLGLQKFMFDNLYFNPACKSEEVKANAMILALFDYFYAHPEKMPDEYLALMERYGQSLQRTVCDYISCMTDYYSVAVYNELFVPEFWRK